jgi:hypothetical protein
VRGAFFWFIEIGRGLVGASGAKAAAFAGFLNAPRDLIALALRVRIGVAGIRSDHRSRALRQPGLVESELRQIFHTNAAELLDLGWNV